MHFAPKVALNTRGKGNGFSLIELLVIIAILAIIFILLLLSMGKQVPQSRDAERKADLEKIKVAFEDYYNDEACYPPPDVLQNCEGADFRPYLSSIPCDPMSGDPYIYIPLQADGCKGYRVLAGLERDDDPAIAELDCDGVDGCGYGADYNYGVAAGTTVFDPDGEPLPSPTPVSSPVSPSPSSAPSPSGIIYVYACDNSGVCNQFEVGHPALVNCPVTFPQTDCNSECGNPAVRCL